MLWCGGFQAGDRRLRCTDAGGELFVADTAEEIDRLVSDKYPGEVPHVRYIPREKCDLIYAYHLT